MIGDGVVMGLKTPFDKQIILDKPVRKLTIGLPYTHVIEPLPPGMMSTDGAGRTMRLVKAMFRLCWTRVSCALIRAVA